MHPYSVAKMVASLGYLHNRRIFLNMVAGGFKTDLLALSDDTPHDQRYERLLEYTLIIKNLLLNQNPYSFTGKFYRVKDLMMKPVLPKQLAPEIFLSGSSEAGMATARALGATAVEYPKPGEEYSPCAPRQDSGIRIGIISDEDSERAWTIARTRFPDDRMGKITHMVAMKVSDSQWHKQLSDIAQDSKDIKSIYWLWPFQNYSTFCPYLVGSYEEVSTEILKYLRSGFVNFILDIPAEESDLRSAHIVFQKAAEKLRNETAPPSS
jgi:alkanesulfonate monooxygenase